MDLVNSSSGSTQKGNDNGVMGNSKPTKAVRSGGRKNISIIPSNFAQTDVSGVKGETLIFLNMVFYFINVPQSDTIDHFHKMVTEHGGTFSMNLNNAVTHCVAAEKKGIKYQAAIRHGDVIHVSWVLDCCSQKKLVHLQPKYFLFLAESSKNKFQEEIDIFSDYYYMDLDITDMKQIFNNMTCSDNPKFIDHYKKKYFPMESLCLFQDCHVYFYEMSIMNKDLKTLSELASRRMKLEITMRGGEICVSISHATHIVVYTLLGSHNFDELYQSFLPAQRKNLHNKKLHVVRHQWLDDSLSKGKKLAEIAYNLKPDTLEDLKFEESKEEDNFPPTKVEEKVTSRSLDTSGKRKRGRPAQINSKRGKPAPKLYKRTRAMTGMRTAKINSDETEDIDASDDEDDNKEAEETIQEDKKIEPEIAEDTEDVNATERNIEDAKFDLGSEIINVDETRKEGTGEQIEQMVDPLQALLLDMIPSLSQKSVVTGTGTGTGVGSSTVSKVEEEKIEGDPVVNPVKKKKVSYKDVANQLLKDW